MTQPTNLNHNLSVAWPLIYTHIYQSPPLYLMKLQSLCSYTAQLNLRSGPVTQLDFFFFSFLSVYYYYFLFRGFTVDNTTWGVCPLKVNDPNLVSFSNGDRKRKEVSFPLRSCIHMWPVELLFQAGTAVSGRHWGAGRGRWIQLII